MTPDKTDRPQKTSIVESKKKRTVKKNLTPDRLLDTISRQNEALNTIIKKFSEPRHEKEKSNHSKKSNKSKEK